MSFNPKGYSSEGIILARRNFGEADRIIVLLSKDYGKVSLIAKGVRKLKSRKRGHIEIFSQVKFQSAKTNSLGILTEAITLNSFEDLRSDLRKISVAYFFVEAVGRITHDDEKNIELYNHLLDYMNKIANSESLKKLRKDFLLELLVILGFWPKGQPNENPDSIFEEVIERKMNSSRVGKKVLQ